MPFYPVLMYCTVPNYYQIKKTSPNPSQRTLQTLEVEWRIVTSKQMIQLTEFSSNNEPPGHISMIELVQAAFGI